MEKYGNRGGDSGIAAFEIGDDYLDVEFSDGSVYRWDNESCGHAHLARMKSLASAGEGLNSYINKYVKKQYARKVR